MDIITTLPGVAVDRRSKGRLTRIVRRGVLALLGAAVVAQAGYTYSGSNQWDKLGERNGVTLYSLKQPGNNIKKFKAVWKVHTTLSKFVMFSQKETDLANGDYDMRDIEAPSEQLIWSTWKERFPSPLLPREYVTRNEYLQDPQTKELLFKVTADPAKIPPDDCCVRIKTMTNTWRLTPLKAGEFEMEWFVDMDLGGVVPYFMQNALQPDGMLSFASRVQKYLDREKYLNAKYEWIVEP